MKYVLLGRHFYFDETFFFFVSSHEEPFVFAVASFPCFYCKIIRYSNEVDFEVRKSLIFEIWKNPRCLLGA